MFTLHHADEAVRYRPERVHADANAANDAATAAAAAAAAAADNMLGNDGATALAPLLECSKTLRVLNLKRTPLHTPLHPAAELFGAEPRNGHVVACVVL